jgi:Cu+-exporting ATPase
MATDPVCGMPVDPATAQQRFKFGGSTYYFCSAGCREAFEKDPERYLSSGRAAVGEGPPHHHR